MSTHVYRLNPLRHCLRNISRHGRTTGRSLMLSLRATIQHSKLYATISINYASALRRMIAATALLRKASQALAIAAMSSMIQKYSCFLISPMYTPILLVICCCIAIGSFLLREPKRKVTATKERSIPGKVR